MPPDAPPRGLIPCRVVFYVHQEDGKVTEQAMYGRGRIRSDGNWFDFQPDTGTADFSYPRERIAEVEWRPSRRRTV